MRQQAPRVVTQPGSTDRLELLWAESFGVKRGGRKAW